MDDVRKSIVNPARLSGEYQGEVVPYYPASLPRAGPDALYVAVAQVTQKSNLGKVTGPEPWKRSSRLSAASPIQPCRC